MSDIHSLLDREARRVEPTSDWMEPTLAKVRRRQRSRRLVTTLVSLAIAGIGLLVVMRTFERPTSIVPAGEKQPNYEFHDITIERWEGPALAERRLGWVISSRVTYEEYPGVHRCTWRVYRPDDELVGEYSELFASHAPTVKAGVTLEDPAPGAAVRGEISCDPARLDTPGIDHIATPPPDHLDYPTEVSRRVEEWAERFEVREMSREELQANIQALRVATARATARGNAKVILFEIARRTQFLEELLDGRGQKPSEVPAGGTTHEEDPRISKISDGYLLYEGDWQGVGWELVALPVQESRAGCGNSAYVVAFRYLDGGDLVWQSCPDPFVAVQSHSTLNLADEGVLLVGTVATEVTSIQVETDDGRTVEGVLIPMADALQSSVNAFVMEVPAPHEGRVVVMDAEGAVLQEEPLQVTIPTIPSATTGDVLTDTQPYDDLLGLGWAAVQDEVRARLSDWSARVGVSDMAPNELVAAMDTITEAVNGRGDSEDWLRLRELMARRELLCVELPRDHIYRNGEYCS